MKMHEQKRREQCICCSGSRVMMEEVCSRVCHKQRHICNPWRGKRGHSNTHTEHGTVTMVKLYATRLLTQYKVRAVLCSSRFQYGDK